MRNGKGRSSDPLFYFGSLLLLLDLLTTYQQNLIKIKFKIKRCDWLNKSLYQLEPKISIFCQPIFYYPDLRL